MDERWVRGVGDDRELLDELTVEAERLAGELEARCWVAHEEPERPLAFGAWLCACEACRIALQGRRGSRAEAADRPQDGIRPDRRDRRVRERGVDRDG